MLSYFYLTPRNPEIEIDSESIEQEYSPTVIEVEEINKENHEEKHESEYEEEDINNILPDICFLFEGYPEEIENIILDVYKLFEQSHSFQVIREQIFGSNDTMKSADPVPMNAFVQQARSMSEEMTDTVMNGFQPDKVTVYNALDSEFAVFDRWFASVPASTQPNRLYVHSGTSYGAKSNNTTLLAKGYPQRTIFENLADAGLSFSIYYQNVPAVLFYGNLRKLKYITKFHSYENEFKAHSQKGSLPNYAVIEQRYMDSKNKPATDDHRSHDVYQGQMFIKEVYESLHVSPQWNQTLLIMTYDEHGGFYYHIPTPVKGVLSPDGIIGHDPYYFAFDRLGVKVPTIMVSPWIEKGTVVHGPNGVPTSTSEYEHSSIPATAKKIFNLQAPFLTRRDAWAGTFECTVQTRTEPRTNCPEQLPTPVQIRQGEVDSEEVGNDMIFLKIIKIK